MAAISSAIGRIHPVGLNALAGNRRQLCLVEIGRDHRGAFGREGEGSGAADALCSGRDEGGLAGETVHDPCFL